MEAPEGLKELFLEGLLPLRAADDIQKTLKILEELGYEDLREEFLEDIEAEPENYAITCREYAIIAEKRKKEEEAEETEEVAEEAKEEVAEEAKEEPKLVPASKIKLPPAKPLTPLETEEEEKEEQEAEEEVEEVVVEEEVEERPAEAKEEEEERLPEDVLEELRADMRVAYVHLLAAKTKDAVLTTLHEIRAVCEKWIEKLASQ